MAHRIHNSKARILVCLVPISFDTCLAPITNLHEEKADRVDLLLGVEYAGYAGNGKSSKSG